MPCVLSATPLSLHHPPLPAPPTPRCRLPDKGERFRVNPGEEPPVLLPAGISDKLKPHQREGICFMWCVLCVWA